MPQHLHSAPPLAWLALAHIVIVIFFGLRLLSTPKSPGVVLAWMLVIAALPFIGALLYILIGERSVGRDLSKKIVHINDGYGKIASSLQKQFIATRESLCPESQALSLLAESRNGSPVIGGNKIELHTESLKILQLLIDEINQAKKSLHLEFYIWALGGDADRVGEALIAASKRGISCLVLLDAFGSNDWFKSEWPSRFKEAGIQVTKALPIQFGRFQFRRVDLRLHRKILVIDGTIAWTGSMNLVDPRLFKRDAGVGQWVDAMVRIEGPVVRQFDLTFSVDWSVGNSSIKNFKDFSDPRNDSPNSDNQGPILAQEFSSGPVYRDNVLYQTLLSAIMNAREELIITTPYFGPDVGLFQALMGAARKGVKVTLIIPKLNDSTLVAWSSKSYYSSLMNSGVRIAEFHGGLLHTKCMLIDNNATIFGSVNFDQRSLRLNFEISLIVYNKDFASQIQTLINSYLSQSNFVNPNEWAKRACWRRYLENAAQMTSPIL
ncbi:cardiolipin synthase [Polynucleobacter sp. 86C-FISCH]|uniref:cardiolipin synthase n=1 Tax=Polynucleobacter sp. 86C-FISCH TaxID=2689101 RepID=UPI00351D7406